jgi:SAM-dependent MidA family methyltransferase
MNQLESRLHSLISKNGPLTFAEFMSAALYDPEHGYYGSAKAGIGREGDFYTSVSAGPLFGRMLARQFAQMWEHLGRPTQWTLVEQGAHNGDLAADVLEALRTQAPACFDATQLFIVEPLACYRSIQQEKLAPYRRQASWFSDSLSLPSFTGIHYSNELLDAFPVHRLQRGTDEWQELRVTNAGETFGWVPVPIDDPELSRAAKQLPGVQEGFCMEVSLGHSSWVESLWDKMDQGWVLAFDYGMTADELAAPHRKDGTLSAYRNHQRQPDPLAAAGELDLTAHVNFTAIARDALELGWTLEGYTDQHRFFTGLAPLHFRELIEPMTPAEQKERLAFRTLAHPQMMGAQFKVFCLGRNLPGPLPMAGYTFGRNPHFTLGVPKD